MSHRPDLREPDDGLAELVDQLEQLVDFEAWRPRYALGMDGTRNSPVVVLNLTTGQLVNDLEEPLA